MASPGKSAEPPRFCWQRRRLQPSNAASRLVPALQQQGQDQRSRRSVSSSWRRHLRSQRSTAWPQPSLHRSAPGTTQSGSLRRGEAATGRQRRSSDRKVGLQRRSRQRDARPPPQLQPAVGLGWSLRVRAGASLVHSSCTSCGSKGGRQPARFRGCNTTGGSSDSNGAHGRQPASALTRPPSRPGSACASTWSYGCMRQGLPATPMRSCKRQ